ncbi:hypothetical protein EFB08_03490 [Rufibacter latericius]|uniref:Uncharacterized protein n=1 Tax=Rufibacter latericius TaxID=2487040 RepID=A0A3M9N1B7_9BACT|nr:hypothetical protein EFB08_03490 [Rufibacter latericius]
MALILLASCQSNSPQPGASGEESRKQVTLQEKKRSQDHVLEKDTLNALQEEVIRKTSRNKEEAFRVFFSKFAQSIEQQQAEVFNQFIDPELGLYLIESPGAVPHFTFVTDIKTFRRANAQQGSFFTIREAFTDCKLEEVKELPTLTCAGENNNFTRQGCFVADAAVFRKSDAYKYADLPTEEQRRIAQHQAMASKTVLHTGSGFKFHFGQVKGQWRVLFADLMVPCSA